MDSAASLPSESYVYPTAQSWLLFPLQQGICQTSWGCQLTIVQCWIWWNQGMPWLGWGVFAGSNLLAFRNWWVFQRASKLLHPLFNILRLWTVRHWRSYQVSSQTSDPLGRLCFIAALRWAADALWESARIIIWSVMSLPYYVDGRLLQCKLIFKDNAYLL